MGYTLRAKGIKDDFQITNPDYVYTRRTSRKRSYEDSGSGSKRFKGSDEVKFLFLLQISTLLILDPTDTTYLLCFIEWRRVRCKHWTGSQSTPSTHELVPDL